MYQASQPQTKGFRKYVYTAIGCAAAVLGGMAIFGNVEVEDQSTFMDIEATSNLISMLSTHNEYLTEQH